MLEEIEHLWTFLKVNGRTTLFVILQIVQDRSFFEYKIAKSLRLPVNSPPCYASQRTCAVAFPAYIVRISSARPRTPSVTWPRCAVLDDLVMIDARKYHTLSSLLIIRLPNDIMGFWCYWSGEDIYIMVENISCLLGPHLPVFQTGSDYILLGDIGLTLLTHIRGLS